MRGRGQKGEGKVLRDKEKRDILHCNNIYKDIQKGKDDEAGKRNGLIM